MYIIKAVGVYDCDLKSMGTTDLQRIKKYKGYIVAFSFGKGSYEEVVRVKQEGLFIELLTVDKLLKYEEPAGQGKMF